MGVLSMNKLFKLIKECLGIEKSKEDIIFNEPYTDSVPVPDHVLDFLEEEKKAKKKDRLND